MKTLRFFLLIFILFPAISNAQSYIYPSNPETFNLTQAGSTSNCGISIDGTTLTINGSDGSALSAVSPCKIGIASDSTGEYKTATFSSNVTLTFGSASNMSGNLFGISEANWAQPTPFFFGIVDDGTSQYFTVSRVPLYATGSAATDLCQKGDNDCDGQNDAMLLTSGLTLANWTHKPITNVGWVGATYVTSGTVWTLSLLDVAGFNKNYLGYRFKKVTGQMGAASGSMFYSNGGTAPTFSTVQDTYQWMNSNTVCEEIYESGDGGTDGSGVVNVKMSMAYKLQSGYTDAIRPGIFYTDGATTISAGVSAITLILENTSEVQFRYLNTSAVPTALTNSFYTNGSRNFNGTYCYSANIN